MGIRLKMTNRERELMVEMRDPSFYNTLRELIHEFLRSYKRLKYFEAQVKVRPLNSERYKMEYKYFYAQYFGIRAYQSLYDFCKKDRKVRMKPLKDI